MKLFMVSVMILLLSVFWVHCGDSDNGSPDDNDPKNDVGTDEETTDMGETDTEKSVDTETEEEKPTDTEPIIRVDVETLIASADFVQSNDENGLVVIEAEDYTVMVPATDIGSWEPTTSPAGYSGEGAMQAKPSEYVEHKDLLFGQNNAPILVYSVEFVKAEPVFVWGRASHIDGYTDSVWYGKDGLIEGTSPLSFWDDEHIYLNEWYYIQLLMEGDYAMLEVSEVGVHTFELYMREPDFAIDKIVLTTNPDFHPDSLEK